MTNDGTVWNASGPAVLRQDGAMAIDGNASGWLLLSTVMSTVLLSSIFISATLSKLEVQQLFDDA